MSPDLHPFRVGVVVQTHWDREWYFSREQFLARLLRVMERVVAQLEAGRLQQFLFDGQVAALEDLLAHAEPALCERVLSLVREGRIVLGPWYVMADEFLCAGESLWRNLELGIQDARAYGNCQHLGYLPDSFGHIAQMPQILRAFGIQSAVLWRGVDTEHSEFDWIAPDGSSVPTLFLTQGYYQHPLNLADWRGALERYLAQIAPRALSPNLLLTQGGDHLLPHAEMAARMAEFNASQTRYQLVEESLQAHAERSLAASAGLRSAVHGELRANVQAVVLPDVLSTRRQLKLWMQTLEDRLLGEIEPLYAQLRVPLPARALEQCWRTLLQQQAHDSICGCSVDSVHSEMLARFEQLSQRLDGMRQQALLAAGLGGELMSEGKSPFTDDRLFTLFNPLPQAVQGWQTVTLFLSGEAVLPRLLGPEGQVLPSELLSVSPAREFHSPLDDFPDPVLGHRYELALNCSLAGLQALALRVEDAPLGSSPTAAVAELANAQLRVSLTGEGELLLHSAEGAQALWLETELDAGDSYNFSPPALLEGREQRRHARFELLHAHRQGEVQELLLSLRARLPAGLNAERSGPSLDEVECSGRLRLRLLGDSPFVHAQLDWDNQARDQRTRLVLPLATSVSESHSDGSFAWVARPLVLAAYPSEPSKREMPVAVNPSYSALAVGPLSVAHRAMQEFEIITLDGGQQALALTLVRSIGWLSRRDLVTRGVGAGPDMATPEAQCLGEQRFEFRFGLSAALASLALLREAAELRRPALVLRGHAESGVWREPVQLDNPVLQVSAFRRCGNQLELRVWNPTAESQDLRINGAGWEPFEPGALPQPGQRVKPYGIASFRKTI